MALNEEILSAVDSSWSDIFAGRPRPYLSNFARVYRQRAVEELARAYDDADVIVLKDPRINVLAGLWDTALKAANYDPTYIFMVRHPLEVAASLLKTHYLPVDHSLLLWLDHMLAAERDTRDARRVFIRYDELLTNSRDCLDRIETAAGVPFPRRTAQASNNIAQFISVELRHHVATAETGGAHSQLKSMAAQAYAWFLDAASGASQPAGQGLDPLRKRLDELYDTVGNLLAQQQDRLSNTQRHADNLEDVVGNLRQMIEQENARAAHLQAALEAAEAGAKVREIELNARLNQAEAQNIEFAFARAQLQKALTAETCLRESERLTLQSELERQAQEAARLADERVAEMDQRLAANEQRARDEEDRANGLIRTADSEREVRAATEHRLSLEQEARRGAERLLISLETGHANDSAEIITLRSCVAEVSSQIRRLQDELDARTEREEGPQYGSGQKGVWEVGFAIAAEHAEATATSLYARLDGLEQDKSSLMREAQALRRAHEQVLNSTSWRLSAFPRWILSAIKRG